MQEQGIRNIFTELDRWISISDWTDVFKAGSQSIRHFAISFYFPLLMSDTEKLCNGSSSSSFKMKHLWFCGYYLL